MAQLALTIGGAILGGLIAGPAGVVAGVNLGAVAGGIAGSLIGALLFPPKLPHPQLPDVHIQRSSNGDFIPIVYGSVRVGNIVVDAPEKFTRNESGGGGKGGPSAPPTVSYSVDWLDCLLCESRGDHSARKVWHTGRLVANLETGEGELPAVFYDGDQDQLADPTEESHYGVGMVSARRGVARLVYTNLGLSDTGAVLPIVNVEMRQGVVHTDHPISLDTVNNNPTGHQWPNSGVNSQDPCVMSWPIDGANPLIRVLAQGTSTVYTYDPTTLAYVGSEGAAAGETFPPNVGFAGDLWFLAIGTYRYANGSTTSLWGRMGRNRVDGSAYTPVVQTGSPISSTLPTVGGGGPSITGDTNFLQAAGLPANDRPKIAMLSQDGKMLFVGVTTQAQVSIDADKIDKWYRIIDGTISSFGTISPTLATNGPCGGSGGQLGYTKCGMFENDYRNSWVLQASADLISEFWINDAGNYEQAAQHFVPPPGGSGGGLTLLGESTLNAHEFAFALPGGCKCGVVAGKSLWLVERCEVSSGVVRLKDIVADQHERCGETSYNVDELIDIVRGYGIFAQPTGRSAIEALRDIFAFDSVDSDTGIKYVKLGKPSICSIPDGDLCAHDEHGNAVPSPLQVVLGNDLELPRQIWLKYMDYDAEYLTGAQSWHRQNTESVISRVIDTAVVLTATEAKQIVDAIGQRTLTEADKYTWFTTRGGTALDADDNPLPYILLEPTDVVTVKGIDLRITRKVEQMATGIIRWEGVRSHPGVVVQTGSGGGGSDGIPTQEIPIAQDTELVIGDWPWIEDETQQSVAQVAMEGALRRSWKGASLQESTDGGTNFAQRLFDNKPATIGETLTALPNFGGGYVFDESSRPSVLIHPGGGELVSATRRAVLGGANFAMVGAEMIQFRDADLTDVNTYTLSGLLRGRHGTQWAMRGHAIGDIFCLLPTPDTIDIGSGDLGITQHYKAVTSGRTLASASDYPFRANGVSLAPYAPFSLASGFTVDMGNAMRLTWRRRTRFGRGWVNARSPTGQDSMPLAEASESYRVRIYTDGTFQTVVRTATVTAREFLYVDAMQTADFGAPLTVAPAWGVAQIGQLGPGYEMLSNGVGPALPLFIPTTTGGYVPPIPAPSDAIDDVMPWVEATTIHSGAFGPNDAWVIQFTTGSVDSGAGGLVRLQGAEFGGPPSPRQWTLSPIAGDFGPQAMPGAQGGGSPSVTALFVVGAGTDYGFYPTIPQSTTWYLNIRNQPSSYLDMPMFCTLLNVP